MKKPLLAFLLAAAVSAAHAQPVLTSGNLAPFGTTAPISVAMPGSFNPGGAGANQTWDFSSLSAIPAGNVTIVNPSTTPFATTYPTSNYAYKMDMTVPVPATVYNYYSVLSSGFELLASEVGGPDPNVYTDPRPELKFPFLFNDTYSDTYQSTNMASPETLTRTYDGYGTLMTPSHTYPNAVRMAVTYDGGQTRYQWYNANPLMLLVSENDNGTVIFIVADPQASSVPQTKISSPGLYRNPTSGFVLVENAGTVASVELFDVTGRSVRYVNNPASGIIDLSGIAAGLYTARVMDTNGNIGVRKLSVR